MDLRLRRNPLVLGLGRRSHDVLKTTILLCILMMVSMTMNTLSTLQRTLDSVCCSNSPLLMMMAVSVRKDTSVSRLSPGSLEDCLRPSPVAAEMNKLNQSALPSVQIQQPIPDVCGTLRRRGLWEAATTTTTTTASTARSSHDVFHPHRNISPLAKEIDTWQSNCSIPVAAFHLDNQYGLGSHLYLWSQAFCNAREAGYRLVTVNGEWLWWDQYHCSRGEDGDSNSRGSPFRCYFPHAEERCPQDDRFRPNVASYNHSSDWGTFNSTSNTATAATAVTTATIPNVTDPRNAKLRCLPIRTNAQYQRDFRAAAMEYLFQSVSPLVIQEAQRQMGLLFPPTGQIPDNLITVHIRWGDKFWEMDLVAMEEYVQAITKLETSPNQSTNIYLATEDPAAVEAFLRLKPPHWNVFVDRTVTELTAYRPRKGNRASWMTRNTHGRAGLVALGSLLVALEADRFILTTASNWSRLLNDLRQNVLDPHCGNCTQMIDLRPGIW